MQAALTIIWFVFVLFSSASTINPKIQCHWFVFVEAKSPWPWGDELWWLCVGVCHKPEEGVLRRRTVSIPVEHQQADIQCGDTVTNISVGMKTRVLLTADQSVMEKSPYIDAVLLTKLDQIFEAYYCGCITHSTITYNMNQKLSWLLKW